MWSYRSNPDLPRFDVNVGPVSMQPVPQTDATGQSEIRAKFSGVPVQPCVLTLTADAVVRDMNNQVQQTSASITLHPSTLCVGHKFAKQWIRRGDAAQAELIVTDLEGNAVPNVAINVHVTQRYRVREVDDRSIASVAERVIIEDVVVTSQACVVL